MEQALQLEMNFTEENGNRLRENLNSGQFVMLTEINVPRRDIDIDGALSRLRELEFAVAAIDALPAGIAFIDKYNAVDTWNVAEFAARLIQQRRNDHLVYISGKGSTFDEMVETAAICRNNGFHNIVAVSGDHLPGEDHRATAKRNFTEGIHLLHYLRERKNEPLWPGAVVNPFQYVPDNLCSQLFKMVKKINCGAQFIVTALGWDMLKIQELRHYLNYRQLYYPSLARLMLLTPESVEKIINGSLPGVHISRDFRRMLQSELRYSYKQFEASQWRRLQIQAAGCRLLGYSGIQIAGLDSPAKIATAAAKIARALEEFTDLADWWQAYFDYLGKTEMAPFPYVFYLFERGFDSKHELVPYRLKESQLAQCQRQEKLSYRIKKFLFPHAHKQHANEHFIFKKIFAKCRECSDCRLTKTQYICPETCPKGLANGPCGGARPDGRCEVGDFECIHNTIMRLANWRNQLDQLENCYIEPAKRADKR